VYFNCISSKREILTGHILNSVLIDVAFNRTKITASEKESPADGEDKNKEATSWK
jgi:hypothetical protein